MANHHSQVFENKAPKRRGGVLSRMWGRRDEATSPDMAIGQSSGPAAGQPHGEAQGRNCSQDAEAPVAAVDLLNRITGVDNEQVHGAHAGPSAGQPRGPQYGNLNGSPNVTAHGSPHGSTRRTTLERDLGVELHVVDGVLMACAPPPTPRDHARAFLAWLQGQDKIVDSEVPSKTLDEVLYPYFVRLRGWKPCHWNTVASSFRKLPGVRRRQIDTRHPPWNQMESSPGFSPTVYYIPRPGEQPSAAAVTSASASPRAKPNLRVA